jgi:RNA polymerase sigma-70 factor (ECF subfamily)
MEMRMENSDRLRQFDTAAWTDVVDTYYQPLLLFCGRYVKGTDEAHDPARPFRAWIYTIARNLCIDHLRRQAKAPAAPLPELSLTATSDLLWEVADDAPGPRTACGHRDAYQQVLDALDGLEPIHREVVLLRYIDGMSRHEIAELLEIPENTVKSRLFNALRKVRERLPAQLLTE